MPIGNRRTREIKRLTTPLTFKDSKAYDEKGNLIKCIETINDVRYVLEPQDPILSDEDILKYAPKSKAASEVRLRKGLGNSGDVLLIHESLPWILGIYYVTLICISVPVIVAANRLAMLVLLILFIIPLVYLYRIFNLNSYVEQKRKPLRKVSIAKKESEPAVQETVAEDYSVSSLKRYEKEINELKVLFDVKEQVVRDLIGKRFAPPQITYDKFISIIDSSHKLFYKQADSATNIINLAAEDTPRVQNEIQAKIDAMHTIIDQIEKLTNELVINISNESGSDEDVKNLLDDMENLIGSVKEY
ncbi:MAG: hypothetical protein E7Z78_06390 [Methanobrevibacter thaueri]|jgi:hypothetical protein|uniref:hypothetical protein n=1 Tax=Methanobrevibacter thaueri TaxID=190975 RepID=UPI0026E98DEB|nr:hypothetical protein [Methanobrevibacter thaueri]MBE6496060.1 hypothetical protein [Methanobrevibacter thaueri]